MQPKRVGHTRQPDRTQHSRIQDTHHPHARHCRGRLCTVMATALFPPTPARVRTETVSRRTLFTPLPDARFPMDGLGEQLH